ncbi:FAD-dependent oxidoreductase [Amycolatopsis acidiphila]|uniref:FAD-dependent oxidoreductase n=1 Tax=Amycolatopsis acidiphila TaxID=715473 RepID=A0A558ANS6_9PSEU|nr:FAD-dependent oxidoreductase [Amycolatopsis acidiphila]TVT25912.1 FAD-dependent oxidoreductase [Amycolatopsis acidiphila]UIJ63383.1 FAD-dependent oxidoreductase [Amycolatopsis acidiphila]GHG75297.1 3-(3-hydroxyphenyl)propionate hydroxylase [Amycolatopsis acidiphila]
MEDRGTALDRSCEVLVVGAGPTGLTAACELARRGIEVAVVDAAEGPFPGSRGKGLQPRSLEVLDNLGIAGRLIATGRFRMPLRFFRSVTSYQDIDLSGGAEPGPDSPYARTLLIPQWRVEQTLRDLLADCGVRVAWAARVTGLAQDDKGVVVDLADDSRVLARYVIGADGGSSTVRKLAGFTFLGEIDEDEQMLLADVRLDGLDRDFWRIWNRAGGGSLALCPLPATDTFQVQASLPPRAATPPTVPALQEIVDEVLGDGVVRLREASWLSRWRLNVRMVDRYRTGRVFLAGDAAHVHSPAGGQGMNTGIQDAANLGWKLAAVLRGAEPALLDTYQAERLPIAAAMLGLTNRIMGQQPGAHGTDQDELLQMGITYRGGPLALGHCAAGPQPGDRAPDAPCQLPGGRPVRLFDLQRGGRWTLYRFPRSASPILTDPSTMVIYDIGRDIVDQDGHIHDAYQPGDNELILVRPDGHIGLRSTDPAAVRSYLTGVALTTRPLS